MMAGVAGLRPWRAGPAGLLLAACTLAQAQGDAQRGEQLARSRTQGLCVLCHALPGDHPAQQGTVGPPLAGVGARWSADQLRQRLLAPQQFNPDTVMPAYARTAGLRQVAPAFAGQPLLQPAQIDDLVAWMVSLQ